MGNNVCVRAKDNNRKKIHCEWEMKPEVGDGFELTSRRKIATIQAGPRGK
jgi:hypothetical protein